MEVLSLVFIILPVLKSAVKEVHSQYELYQMNKQEEEELPVEEVLFIP